MFSLPCSQAWLALVHSTELFSQAILSDSGHLQTRVKYLLERTLSEKTELRRAFQQRKQLHEETLQKVSSLPPPLLCAMCVCCGEC